MIVPRNVDLHGVSRKYTRRERSLIHIHDTRAPLPNYRQIVSRLQDRYEIEHWGGKAVLISAREPYIVMSIGFVTGICSNIEAFSRFILGEMK